MYGEQYNLSTTLNNQPTIRLNDSYYLDSLPYASYNTNAYPFRQQIPSQSTSSNVYFSSHQHSFSPSTSQLTHPDLTSYSTYDTTYLNAAVAAAYQTTYPNPYHPNTTDDSFDLSFPRHISGFYATNPEQQIDTTQPDRKVPTSAIPPSRKRKFQDESMKVQYESERCRVCDDVSSGYHFGVFTCEACKGFFRRYSKKATILEPCPIRCSINKNNRNNCAACRFDKCKYVGMALDKIRFGKPPKLSRSSFLTSAVKLEPNNNDFQLMLKLLECYQSFEQYDHQPTTIAQSSIIFEFCHRLAEIVMPENERVPERFLIRLKRHESAIKFLITGENDQHVTSWSKEPQAWVFAHNERWRLIMILLILAFDDEQVGGGAFVSMSSTPSSSSDTDENIFPSTNDTVIERILRLFELECDQEKEARTFNEGSTSFSTVNSEKNIKYMKAQFLLRFVDMMTNDMISNRDHPSTVNNSYLVASEPLYRNNPEMIYSSVLDELQIQPSETSQSPTKNM
ncbi:unnamed protein product [Adineta ricciae]|uniref:Nuclear receptor domain-containing protein n=1 Tax=Adineta ricciae TaxID=249248 RepID=A0A814P5U5_ADIRI|nr:unnamed protein product [Adineta ricciae]CAF1100906.1 unnamed protein product [Adineta ricciae]